MRLNVDRSLWTIAANGFLPIRSSNKATVLRACRPVFATHASSFIRSLIACFTKSDIQSASFGKEGEGAASGATSVGTIATGAEVVAAEAPPKPAIAACNVRSASRHASR